MEADELKRPIAAADKRSFVVALSSFFRWSRKKQSDLFGEMGFGNVAYFRNQRPGKGGAGCEKTVSGVRINSFTNNLVLMGALLLPCSSWHREEVFQSTFKDRRPCEAFKTLK